MGYSNQTLVESWGQLTPGDIGGIGQAYATLIATLIALADELIDHHCDVPSGFFNAGGVTVTQELHDSEGDGRVILNYAPVLSVTTLQYNDAALNATANWTTLLQGPGANTNFLLYKREGRLYIYSNAPASGEQKIQVTYKAGYSATPETVENLSARLVAAVIHRIIDSSNRKVIRTGDVSLTPKDMNVLVQKVFTQDLKDLLIHFKNVRMLKG